jgi:hypothetical protein
LTPEIHSSLTTTTLRCALRRRTSLAHLLGMLASELLWLWTVIWIWIWGLSWLRIINVTAAINAYYTCSSSMFTSRETATHRLHVCCWFFNSSGHCLILYPPVGTVLVLYPPVGYRVGILPPNRVSCWYSTPQSGIMLVFYPPPVGYHLSIR